MRRSLVALVVLGLAIAAASGDAAPPPSTYVLVSDSSIRPTVARTSVGGAVEWVNAGRRSHRITSDARAWPQFALAPGKTRTVASRKAGRYPYHVDGRQRGLVIVGTSPAVGTEPPAAGRSVKWTGVIESSTRRAYYPPAAGSCSNNWRTSLAFTVAPNGSLSGTGTATLVDGPTCTKIANHPPTKTIKIGVSGSADAKRVLLRLQETG